MTHSETTTRITTGAWLIFWPCIAAIVIVALIIIGQILTHDDPPDVQTPTIQEADPSLLERMLD